MLITMVTLLLLSVARRHIFEVRRWISEKGKIKNEKISKSHENPRRSMLGHTMPTCSFIYIPYPENSSDISQPHSNARKTPLEALKTNTLSARITPQHCSMSESVIYTTTQISEWSGPEGIALDLQLQSLQSRGDWTVTKTVWFRSTYSPPSHKWRAQLPCARSVSPSVRTQATSRANSSITNQVVSPFIDWTGTKTVWFRSTYLPPSHKWHAQLPCARSVSPSVRTRRAHRIRRLGTSLQKEKQNTHAWERTLVKIRSKCKSCKKLTSCTASRG